MSVKRLLRGIYAEQYNENKRKTFIQEQNQKEAELINDIKYQIESYTLAKIELDFNGELFGFYKYYVKNKNVIINVILNRLKSLTSKSPSEDTCEKFDEVRGYYWENEETTHKKYQITSSNEYEITLLISELLKKYVNGLISDEEKELRTISRYEKRLGTIEEKPRKKKKSEAFGAFLTFWAIIFGVLDGFSDKRR